MTAGPISNIKVKIGTSMHEGGWPVWKLKLYIVKSMQAAWCPVWEFKVKISNIHEKEHPCTQHKCFGLFSFQNKMKWFWAKNWIFIKLKYFRALQLWCQCRTYVSEFQWISNFCSPLDSKLKNGRGGGGALVAILPLPPPRDVFGTFPYAFSYSP